MHTFFSQWLKYYKIIINFLFKSFGLRNIRLWARLHYIETFSEKETWNGIFGGIPIIPNASGHLWILCRICLIFWFWISKISLFPHWLNAKFPGFWLDEICRLTKDASIKISTVKEFSAEEAFQENDKIVYLE